jgi:hypothetical protein
MPLTEGGKEVAMKQKKSKKVVKTRDMAAVALALGGFKHAVHKDGKKVAAKTACRGKWKGE